MLGFLAALKEIIRPVALMIDVPEKIVFPARNDVNASEKTVGEFIERKLHITGFFFRNKWQVEYVATYAPRGTREGFSISKAIGNTKVECAIGAANGKFFTNKEIIQFIRKNCGEEMACCFEERARSLGWIFDAKAAIPTLPDGFGEALPPKDYHIAPRLH